MRKITNLLFLSCAFYFIAMAVAHFMGLKYPLLFIYYDVPFYAYQDKIISFAVLAYVALFFEAFRQPGVRVTAILVLYLTVAGLSAVNTSPALREVMQDGQTTLYYWLQTALIFVIALVLTVCHLKSKAADAGPSAG